MMLNSFIKFLKTWTLPIAMIVGALGYILYDACQLPDALRHACSRAVEVIQPALLFAMMFLSSCKLSPKDLRWRPWHFKLLAVQLSAFVLLALLSMRFSDKDYAVVLQAAMLCMICPTATASPVITAKLGGSTASITSYLILVNLCVALVVPVFLPLVNPDAGISFFSAFLSILLKVFPLLLFPLLLAWAVRYFFPKLLQKILKQSDLAFYLWALALALAIAVTTRSLMQSQIAISLVAGITIVSILACALQFYLGKKIGAPHDDKIAAGQSLGQKNTVFIIWLGYTFLDPVTSLAGGLYSIWHNVFNSYQLYRQSKNRA